MKNLLTVIALAISCSFMLAVFLLAPMPVAESPQQEPLPDYPKPKYEACMQERINEGRQEILLFPHSFTDGEFYPIVEKDTTEILYIFPLCGSGKIYRLHEDGLVTIGFRP